jgi:hypothetical protein
VIVTTVQKFIPLFDDKDVPTDLKFAVIADEAHRTHVRHERLQIIIDFRVLISLKVYINCSEEAIDRLPG